MIFKERDRELIQARFNQKINKDPETGHWYWTGQIVDTGYAKMKAGGRKQMAHRIAWELFNGEIPDEMRVNHLCSIKECVNPEHLELGPVGFNGRRPGSFPAEKSVTVGRS